MKSLRISMVRTQAYVHASMDGVKPVSRRNNHVDLNWAH
jgi:hypothetical protein